MTDTAIVKPSPALVRGFSRGVPAESVYLVPRGVLPASGKMVPAFEVLVRLDASTIVSTLAGREQIWDWARGEGETLYAHVKRRIAAIESVREPFDGIAMDRPAVMGILNMTPDSFSDGGSHPSLEAAVSHALAMVEAGADIIDVGGESTRPGSSPVAPEDEVERVVPVIRRLAEDGVRVSVDTRRALVMKAAVEAGARIINDVTGLEGDPLSLGVAAHAQVPVILMHMQGEPGTMQDNPVYSMAPLDVFDYLESRIEACLRAGIERENICIDPGLGFGKTVPHNAQILKRLGMYHGLGCPVLMGFSRKRFIGMVSRNEPPSERLAGSVAAATMAVLQGIQIVRVHDVAETVQALAVITATQNAS